MSKLLTVVLWNDQRKMITGVGGLSKKRSKTERIVSVQSVYKGGCPASTEFKRGGGGHMHLWSSK